MHKKNCAEKKCTEYIQKKNAKKSLIEASEQKKCTEKVHRKFLSKNAQKKWNKKYKTIRRKRCTEKKMHSKNAYKKCTQWLVAASR